jgi:hypothetical protein
MVDITLDYTAGNGIISPSTTLYCSLRWNLLPAGRELLLLHRRQPPAECVSAHARFQESQKRFEFGYRLLEGFAAQTRWIRRAHIPEVRGAAPRFLPRERLRTNISQKKAGSPNRHPITSPTLRFCVAISTTRTASRCCGSKRVSRRGLERRSAL